MTGEPAIQEQAPSMKLAVLVVGGTGTRRTRLGITQGRALAKSPCDPLKPLPLPRFLPTPTGHWW